MNTASGEIQTRCAQLQSALRGVPLAEQPGSALIAMTIEAAGKALQAGLAPLPVQLLELLVGRAPTEARAWQLLGFAYGEDQRLPDAARAFAHAATLDTHEPVTASAHAQSTLDAGFPAAALFEHAFELVPTNLALVNGWAAALAAQGDTVAAEALLSDTLLRHPDWLAGHKALAAQRFIRGDTPDFTQSYRLACTQQPQNLPLRLAWFGAVAQTRDWKTAAQIVVDGERLMGAVPAFLALRAIMASESGERELADDLFSKTALLRDDALGIAHVRHCLKNAQLEEAEKLALGLLQGTSAASIWPYLSLIWRIRGDPRAAWLDGAPPYVRTFDLDYSARELNELAAVLRSLHTARGPLAEQSVRGGTQTSADRQLFYRAEPEINEVKIKVRTAIREYVSALPYVPGHPLLGVQRTRLLFSGSWSVRLSGQGFHVSHTHPMGWISSALYIALPRALGAEPAGWISFGVPPAGLGLTLPPYLRVEPKPGRLVLFPSTMWHETIPFDDGERLVIAFDVMKPRRLP